MFMGGYGAGVIRALADTLGLAVLAPAALGALNSDGIRAFLDHAARVGSSTVVHRCAGGGLTADERCHR
jgi:hypothetical protein